MGSREVPYYEDEICDVCGGKGAYDFMGDCICPDCMNKEQNKDKEIIMKNQIKELSESLFRQKEKLIIDAISHQMGHDEWITKEISNRGVFKNLPNGDQIFCFDNVDLICLYPPELEMDNSGNYAGMKIDVIQKYKLLYVNKKE